MRTLKFCKGVNKLEDSKLKCSHFKEHMSREGDENDYKLCFRSEKCVQILPFQTSNTSSINCYFCKKLEKPVKRKLTTQTEDKCENVQNNNSLCNDENTVTLCERDNRDMSIVLKLS